MGARESLQKLADKKELEIGELRLRLAQGEAYLQAIQDSLRVLPKDSGEAEMETELRPGTMLAQARDLLKAAGKPLHVVEILKLMGKPVEKSSRISLSGSMAAYVRKRQIFKKTGPNIFALISAPGSSQERDDPLGVEAEDDLPESFGNVQ